MNDYRKQKTILTNLCNLAGISEDTYNVSMSISSFTAKGYPLYVTMRGISFAEIRNLVLLAGGKVIGVVLYGHPDTCGWVGFNKEENEITKT